MTFLVWNPGYFWIEQARRKESARLRREFVKLCDRFVRGKGWRLVIHATGPVFVGRLRIFYILLHTFSFPRFKSVQVLTFAELIPLSTDPFSKRHRILTWTIKVDILVSLPWFWSCSLLTFFADMSVPFISFHSRLLKLKHQFDWKQTHGRFSWYL